MIGRVVFRVDGRGWWWWWWPDVHGFPTVPPAGPFPTEESAAADFQRQP